MAAAPLASPASAAPEAPPLPSEPDDEEGEEDEDDQPTPNPSPAPPRPPFKFSTFVLAVLFMLGIVMLFEPSTRDAIAKGIIGVAFTPVIGFHGGYLVLTMFLAAALEMVLTAVAYNYTTDWVKAAKVAKWSAAFRKVQMEALRSGKKDRTAALQPHQQKLSQISLEVSGAQLKGMAITWFLVIAIYAWVGIFVTTQPVGISNAVSLGGDPIPLSHQYGPVALWFLLFTLYTVPLSFLFRRLFKHYSLAKLARSPASAGPAPSA